MTKGGFTSETGRAAALRSVQLRRERIERATALKKEEPPPPPPPPPEPKPQPQYKDAPASSDAEVVITADLKKILDRWIIIWENEYPVEKKGMMYRPFGNYLTARAFLVEKTGYSDRTIYRILEGQSKTTAIKLADAILSAIGWWHLLGTDELPVIPNPSWTQERWYEYMRQKGCQR